MARPARILKADAWYHLTARGIERRPIFLDDKDRKHFCELLAEWVDRFGVVLHAYVLMDNHYHLLAQTPQPNLSAAMQWLNLSYTAWFNRRRKRCGHLFQGRFKAIILDPIPCALMLSRYVHLNPVRLQRLGLDKAAQKTLRQGLGALPDPALVRERLQSLRAYRWSSYAAYAGRVNAPSWLHCKGLLEFIGSSKGDRRATYREYVESAIREGLPERPWDKLVEQAALGSAAFIRSLRPHWRGQPREVPGLQRLRGLPTWKAALAVVEELRRAPWDQFRDAHGDWGRDLALYLGQRRCGLRLRELGALAGGMDYSAVSVAIRRLEHRAKTDKSVRKLLERANSQLSNV
jgi:putative transposase